MTLKEEPHYFEADISPYEHYHRMLSQEHVLSPLSAPIPDRTRLVQLLFAVGKRLNQSMLTVHLGVRLLDRVFGMFQDGDMSINPAAYDLIANGCLLIAAKFEELDMNIPMMFDIQVANKFKITYH